MGSGRAPEEPKTPWGLVQHRSGSRALDKDTEAPQLPPSYWAGTSIGRYHRPLKTQISLRIDNEILAWLKSKGEGHLSRINEILRERMAAAR